MRDSLGHYRPDPTLNLYFDAQGGSGRGAFRELRRSLSLREADPLMIVNPYLLASRQLAGVRRADYEVQLGSPWGWGGWTHVVYRRQER